MVAQASGGAVINLWKSYNFYSKAQSDHYFDWSVDNVYDCQVSGDGKILYIVTRTKLYKFVVSDLTTRSNSFVSSALTVSGIMWRVGTSLDGKYVVVGYQNSLNYPRWKYSSDFGATFSDSAGVLLNSDLRIGGIKISNDGSIVAAPTFSTGGPIGYVLTSNDFGRTFSTSSVADNSVYNVAISDDGSRIIGGTLYNGGNSNRIYFLASD
jgi:hypothetical protein